MLHQKGLALILSAPSGAGKSTLIQRLQKDFTFNFSISSTTRPPRVGEIDGVHYHFLSKEEFITRRNNGYFAEWAQVHGNYYGTPLEPVNRSLEEGKNILFDIDIQGAKQLSQTLPTAKFVFILPPSMEELEKRLVLRGTDSKEDIQIRMKNAHTEIREAHWFDALIINDSMEKAYEKLRVIYLSASSLPAINHTLIDEFLIQK